jgi:hypothetical protein
MVSSLALPVVKNYKPQAAWLNLWPLPQTFRQFAAVVGAASLRTVATIPPDPPYHPVAPRHPP